MLRLLLKNKLLLSLSVQLPYSFNKQKKVNNAHSYGNVMFNNHCSDLPNCFFNALFRIIISKETIFDRCPMTDDR